jgi:hypothetical protein
MKKRNVIAFMMAAVMTVGAPLTVMADEPAKTSDVTVTGTVDYVNTNIERFELPTSDAISELTMDPQGLLGMTGDTATESELSAYAGKIKSTGYPTVTNLSSKKKLVTVEISASATGNDAVTFVQTESAVTSSDDSTHNIWLYAMPSKENTKGNGENYEPQNKAFAITTTPKTLKFVLDAEEYAFTKQDDGSVAYQVADGATGNSTSLYIGGALNKNADWSNFTGDNPASTVSVKVTYTLSDPSESDTANVSGIYGITDATGAITLATLPSFKQAASVSPTSGNVTAYDGKDVTATINLGNQGATAIKSISAAYTVSNGTEKTKAFTTSNYTVSGDTLTIKSSAITGIIKSTATTSVGTSATLTITFDNGDVATMTVSY